MKKLSLLLLGVGIFLAGFASRRFFESEHLRISAEENQRQLLLAIPAASTLRSGDLIFRHGRGFISNALMSLGQKEKKYSHAGIISVESGNVFVYHALGGEENISNKLRKDKLELFCQPADVHGFGIYRTDLTAEEIRTVLALAEKYYRAGLEFDTKFDLATDEKMYCTEFVYKVFAAALGEENYISLSRSAGKTYVSCDDIYSNTHCTSVYAYQY